MLLYVSDDDGLIGTLELREDSTYQALPITLSELVSSRVEFEGKSVRQAFESLNGWSNGQITVTDRSKE